MDEKRRTDLKEAGRRITSGERWSATARRERPLPLWKRPLHYDGEPDRKVQIKTGPATLRGRSGFW